jgi:TRAP-type C4-dicarboxylate transport system permease small subunit
MDVFIDFFNTHMTYVLAVTAILLMVRLFIALLHKGFSYINVFISLFTFYDSIEINSIPNRRRAALMWWGNTLNVVVFLCILLIAFVLIVTSNTNQF